MEYTYLGWSLTRPSRVFCLNFMRLVLEQRWILFDRQTWVLCRRHFSGSIRCLSVWPLQTWPLWTTYILSLVSVELLVFPIHCLKLLFDLISHGGLIACSSRIGRLLTMVCQLWIILTGQPVGVQIGIWFIIRLLHLGWVWDHWVAMIVLCVSPTGIVVSLRALSMQVGWLYYILAGCCAHVRCVAVLSLRDNILSVLIACLTGL